MIGLMIGGGFVSGQVPKDTLRNDSVYPRFHDSFSADESWQIHKEAYRKQLEARGLSGDEINKRMEEYEKRKEEFIERMIEQRKQAEQQRQLAEIQRQKAYEQRKEAEVQRQRSDEQRKAAEVQRQGAEKMRLEAGKIRKQGEIEREKAGEQRQQAGIQREKAEEQRRAAETQRQRAEEQRKEAEAQREKAKEERRVAEELRNSIHTLLSENFTISGKDSEPIVVRINVTNRSSLFFNLNGEISSGTVMMEILNPEGKKRGEFSLEHLKGSSVPPGTVYSGTSSGSMNKVFNSPETGEWSVKITPEKSDCQINISVAQYTEPTIDE